MADERNYYVLCANNCKFESMTKEQILAAIEQAVSTGEIKDVDTGFITKIKEQNSGAALTFWVGTTAQYNALTEYDPFCHYIKTDDSTLADISNSINQLEKEVERNDAALNEHLAKVPEYVVEEDQMPIWYYRKWNSGVAECWGTIHLNGIARNKQSGALYYTEELDIPDFPNGLFILPPYSTCIDITNASMSSFIEKSMGASITNVGMVFLGGSVSSDSINVQLSVYAKGRWK